MTTIESEPESFDKTLALFTEQLGYRLEMISPADDPAMAIVERDGHRLEIRRGEPTASPADGLAIPELKPARHIATMATAAWNSGRAGMRYRDLIPDRLGGRFIASHIEVCDGGPVPDMVHHHAIRFQLIVCQRGWVDVVYEDQGPAFRLVEGDAVLQPPHIRHRVLASSAGARVVEIGCPAEHDTLFDHELELPTTTIDPDRNFGGQKFVWHRKDETAWEPARFDGFEVQVSNIAAATDGLADMRILRPGTSDRLAADADNAEFHFLFVLNGTAQVGIGPDEAFEAVEGDAVTLAPSDAWSLSEASEDLRILEIRLPG